ncbi:MAG: Lysophospholipase-like protein [Solirubrobacterales bacterium]|jgi:alpha-beta hydrolase superfamily lysophospholipase|nr:Lysophospholipase-like protein [Solirubrobacterales bacterium]
MNPYAAYLPSGLTAVDAEEPSSTWWTWEDIDVHVLRRPRPGAPYRLLVLHGGGGHAGALWPLAEAAAGEEAELIAPDLPGFGRTRVPRRRAVAYDDWVSSMSAFVAAERRRDPRPLILLGASMGGMLAYDVAGRTRAADAVVATCLLDTRLDAVRVGVARSPVLGRIGARIMPLARPLDRLPVPMRWVANMNAIANDPQLARLCATDPLGGATSMPVRFLRTWFAGVPAVEPEDFDVCPVVLAHPAEDRWTPVELSRSFFERLQAPKRLVMLEGAGHFPVEQPGVGQLAEAVATVARDLRPAGASAT